CTVEFYAMDYW
nr:immunoglobulin heavy chain junction region [Mus musculus]NSM03962.1 immunoglobulin heavy chain junction region [Mus musculus]NSM04935.1 immunoglobulin heavy chain junction region [Mus musculus]NSM05604.1 immunoglobulin heavy chain junction region [Mus musculus]NSM05929.1 immunoglobulin heavy chain junction region [Mus musculus]